MPGEVSVSRVGHEPARLDTRATSWSGRAGAWARWPVSHWELIVGGLAVVAAAVAFSVTLHAHFLKYPGWLAVQKADFILGPIFVGLYWHRRRPHNRLGLLLIGLGVLGAAYILESSTVPALFGIGLVFEPVIFSSIIVVILAFPNGRLDGLVPKLIAGVLLVGVVMVALVFNLTAPSLAPVLPISGCKTVCPPNGLAVWSPPSWTPQLEDVNIVAGIVAGLATAALLVWRFLTGTPPRRRALSIGAPIAMLFLLAESIYLTKYLFSPGSGLTSQEPIRDPLHWIYAITPSLFWYGFLFALVGAELYAGRVLRRLNRDALGRPSLRELEGLLRGPLGDPGLRLGFWRAGSREWVDADGARLAAPGAGQDATEVDRDGRAVIQIVHDKQLSEDPELLQAAGAVALMALENAELEGAWQESLREVADSRARLARAGERERQKLERDLHDGAQQRLVTIQVKLRLLQEDEEKSDLDERLEAIRVDAEDAVEDLRTLAHGIYPPLLRDRGVADALRSVAMRTPVPIQVTDERIGRCSPAVEAALYFCSLEAVQNALKHAGTGAHVTVDVGRNRDEVYFTVADDGVGITAGASDGIGLVGMRDRMSAVGGRLEVISSPDAGTTIRGTAPTDGPSPGDDRGAASAATLLPLRR